MSVVQGQILFLSHLPGVTIADEAVPFLQDGAVLNRMTFAEYRSLTRGAQDREREFDPDEPVFFVFATPSDLEDRAGRATKLLELKAKSVETDVLGSMPRSEVFENGILLADAAWSCLSLALPLHRLVSPRHSVMFMHVNAPCCFAWEGDPISTVQLQGDADHEFLFARSLKPPPLTAADLALAQRQTEVLRAVRQSEELDSALDGLLQAQEPALGAEEHAILCAIQLEELLLQGTKQNLRRTFAERGAALVPRHLRSEIAEDRIRALYDLRSDHLHGRSSGGADRETLALGPMLLAAAIRSLAGAIAGGGDLQAVLEGDLEAVAVQDGWQPLDAFRRESRLSGHRRSVVAQVGATMAAPEGTSLLRSPLLGLHCGQEAVAIGRTDPDVLMPLSIHELAELEDRDVRRDHFMRIVGGVATGDLPDEGRSVLLTRIGPDDTPPDGVLAAQANRGLAATVTALRACGFTSFMDPALLGNFCYHGPVRLRQPTVLRQTILTMHLPEIDRPDAEALRTVSQLREMILQWSARQPQLGPLLGLFRQVFLHPALDDRVRARVAFAFIEGALGRFKDGNVEALGKAVCPDATGKWFARHARTLRNRLSHSVQPHIDAVEHRHLLTFTHRLARRLVEHAGTADGDQTHGSFATRLREGG